MKFLAAMCVVFVVSGWGCAAQGPLEPQTHKVKIKVDKKIKKTKIQKVRASRKDRIEFTAEGGPVSITIPTADFEVESSPAGKQDNVRGWILLELEENQSAVLLIPEGFPDNRHDITKDRDIWYLVICGTGPDAYPGEDESPPRIIIRKR
jgi:hypothetical protein